MHLGHAIINGIRGDPDQYWMVGYVEPCFDEMTSLKLSKYELKRTSNQREQPTHNNEEEVLNLRRVQQDIGQGFGNQRQGRRGF